MDDQENLTRNRKQDHIRINLEMDVDSSVETGFDQYFFTHNALPEIDLKDVDLEVDFLGSHLQAPLLISSMTGGTKEGHEINIHLAEAAELRGIAMGVGSQRAGLEAKDASLYYNLRQYAPHIPIYSNLGAIQLKNGYGTDHCKKIVEMAEANALILHLNPLQEALQPEGQTNFSRMCSKIEQVCRNLDVPVIVKEVGWGISDVVARKLVDCGVACIDVAGAGGTSWSQVEKYRNSSDVRMRISADFRDWGIPTADAIKMVKAAIPSTPIIASGGIRKGVDLAKSIALGAAMGGIAGGFLKAGSISSEAAIELIDEITLEMRIAMFSIGASSITDLKHTPLEIRA